MDIDMQAVKQKSKQERQALLDAMEKILWYMTPQARFEFMIKTKYNLNGDCCKDNGRHYKVVDKRTSFNKYCRVFCEVVSDYKDGGFKLHEYIPGTGLSSTIRYGIKGGPRDYYDSAKKVY